MRFTMEIDSGNAAFDESPELEIARIARDAADRVENGHTEGVLKDYNGNTVGKFTVTD